MTRMTPSLAYHAARASRTFDLATVTVGTLLYPRLPPPYGAPSNRLDASLGLRHRAFPSASMSVYGHFDP
jgi:hypothetical protein